VVEERREEKRREKVGRIKRWSLKWSSRRSMRWF